MLTVVFVTINTRAVVFGVVPFTIMMFGVGPFIILTTTIEITIEIASVIRLFIVLKSSVVALLGVYVFSQHLVIRKGLGDGDTIEPGSRYRPVDQERPPASVLLAKAEKLYTLPVIISEIRDAATRSRVETTLLPFITLRSPKPESLKFVANFAKKTGDFAVLSRPDLEVLALGYELECERNGGDWRLRNTPGQKSVNGRPPQKLATEESQETKQEGQETEQAEQTQSTDETQDEQVEAVHEEVETEVEAGLQKLDLEEPINEGSQVETLETKQEGDQVVNDSQPTEETVPPTEGEGEKGEEITEEQPIEVTEEEEEEDDDDGEGWITPSNLKKHQAKDSGSAGTNQSPQRTLQAAILTSDYAMQNVALRINLNLVTPTLARITYLKNWVLRCHGCFAVCKDMEKQFCPKCGQQTLTRTSCSTDEHGNFKVHLKRNFQWNTRGNVFSVPKPVHGSSNGRLPKHVGGKNGWGRDLILAEDQKEHVKQQDEQRRQRKKDIMDDDFLPSLLSGDRHGGGGKIRVGAGRAINSRRKR
ncbi:20S-pre-rRNA D-site endonuclease nob1 [Cladobotryum mycophilum]|uniref:20S-pre-rRNA D-site endonuclease NOB1 n=1 Tax=Cladobotryum mycophilum TaxID=491253 RepID=A0ABR0SPJ9_9HYPO